MPSSSQATPIAPPGFADNDPRERPVEEQPRVSLVVVELDTISKAIFALMEEDNNKGFVKLEERLRAMLGHEDRMIEDLSCYARINFPGKFKIPKFTKYNGTGDPKVHLKYYLMRMSRNAENVPLLIQTFQKSLFEPALQWYVLVEP